MNMYSYEINQILKENKYYIPSTTYETVLSSSQIDHVKYSPYGDVYEIWTSDGWYWKFKIYLEEKENVTTI